MGRLGEVLEAIYDAPRLTGALHARAYQVQDVTRIREVHEWWNRRLPHQGGAMLLMTTSVDGPTDRVESDHEVWWTATDRWRAHVGDRVFAFADGVYVTWAPTVGGVRHLMDASPVPSWNAVLQVRWILDWFDVSVEDDRSVARRPCWSVSLRPTKELPRVRLGMPQWHGTEVDCAIDQETGITLAYVARHQDAVVDSWTTTMFQPVPAIDPGVFAFTPPDGSVLIDPEEAAHTAMLRSAEEAGVDLSDVDTTDHHAVAQAYMQHQHRGFFGPVPPAEQAEQYVPTGPPPADPEAAEAAVRDAFEKMFTLDDDGAIPTVQGGSNLGPALSEAGQRAPGASDEPARVEVHHVKLLGPDDAVAWCSILRSGNTLLPSVVGRARRTAGGWLVARETFAQVVAAAGVRCPPPP